MPDPSTTVDSNDLTAVDAIKRYCLIDSGNDDVYIQSLITAFSYHVLRLTGRDSFNVSSYVEDYDGNGGTRLFLRNTPIMNVTTLVIDGVTVPQSTGFQVQGYFVEQSKKSLGIRIGKAQSTFIGGYPYRSAFIGYNFNRGQGNVHVEYSAGFSSIPADLELAARETVALAYKKRPNLELKSKSLSVGSGSGTTSYVDFEISDRNKQVIFNYTRQAFI